MSRRVAREITFKLVFEYTFYDKRNNETLDLFLLDSSLDGDDKNFVESTYSGIIYDFENLKSIVEKYCQGFSLDRIYRPDLAILILATYEMTKTDVPELVIISEAVALAKNYGAEKSGKFVNGVLAGMMKDKKESKL